MTVASQIELDRPAGLRYGMCATVRIAANTDPICISCVSQSVIGLVREPPTDSTIVWSLFIAHPSSMILVLLELICYLPDGFEQTSQVQCKVGEIESPLRCQLQPSVVIVYRRYPLSSAYRQLQQIKFPHCYRNTNKV